MITTNRKKIIRLLNDARISDFNDDHEIKTAKDFLNLLLENTPAEEPVKRTRKKKEVFPTDS